MSDIWHMLSEEERLFCDLLERIVAERIAPLAQETDESAGFVHAQLAVLAEAGMLGANLPEEFGGAGISAQALLRAVAIVAGGCGATASALTAHYLATDSVLIGGSAAQKADILPRAATGEWLGAFALTEPTAGSDPAARHRGISAFLLPRGTPGFEAGKPERTMGLKGGHVFTLNLDCHLPAEALLGGVEGQGFRTAMRVLDNGRIEVAGQCIGMADAALQIHGGYGYTRDFPIERITRDLRIMRIYEGSSEIQRNIIAGHVLA